MLEALRLAHLADVWCPLPSLEPEHPNNLGNSIAWTGHWTAQFDFMGLDIACALLLHAIVQTRTIFVLT